MAKRRAYELSKDLGLEVKELMAFAKQAGVSIKNNMQGIEEEEAQAILQVIEEGKRDKVVEKRVGRRIIRRRAIPKKPKAKAKPVVEETPEEPEEITEVPSEPETPETAEEPTVDTTDTVEAEVADETTESEEKVEAKKEPEEEKVAEVAETVEVSEVSEEKAPEKEKTEEKPAKEQEEVTTDEKPVVKTDTKEKAKDSKKAPKKADTKKTGKPKQAKEKDAKDEKAKPKKKKKPRKIRQISTIVKKIELEDLEAAKKPGRPPRGKGRRPGPAARNKSSEKEIDFTNIPLPSGEGPSRKKGSRFAREDDDAARGKRKGKGTRKRQVIDDSYFDRRGRGGKKKGKAVRREPQKTQITTPKAIKRVIKLATDTIVVGELAKRMGIKANEIILKLIQMGLRVNVNQAIDLDTASLVATEFDYEVENVAFEEENFLDIKADEDGEQLKNRPPVVTVMGHVDHGKTSILDYIRKTKVASGEAGGITQHIGAYIVRRKKGNITFLDTPGHEAFTAMRARGAQVTDIVILVVAADDGIMPQTIEAINHSKAAGVQLIVAINKIDRPNANIDRVVQQLMQYGLISEDLGGDTIMVKVSAKTGEGIDDLLDMIELQSEMLELKANPERPQAESIVIEGKLDKGRGPVATVLVKHGTLKVGDYFVCGAQSSKIKALIDDRGKRIKNAGPSVPVEVLGFSEVPETGDMFNTLKDEKQAKMIADNRYRKKRDQELAKTSRVSLEELVAKVKTGDMTTLSLVIKADVQGSVEALKETLLKEANEEVKIEIIHSGVGGINESDVLFASASDALIIGFNVRAESKAQILAEQEKIDIKTYSVIYNIIEDINHAVIGLQAPELREEVFGHVEVRDIFTIPKIGTIAGCYVQDGKIQRNGDVRLYRNNVVIYTGKLGSLRRFKDDVSEVAAGYECGIGIDGYNDIKVGDNMEVFKTIEVSAKELAGIK